MAWYVKRVPDWLTQAQLESQLNGWVRCHRGPGGREPGFMAISTGASLNVLQGVLSQVAPLAIVTLHQAQGGVMPGPDETSQSLISLT